MILESISKGEKDMSKMPKLKNIAVAGKKKKMVLLLFLVIVVLIGVIIFFRARKKGARMEGAVSNIQSATAQVSQIDSTVSGTGNISIGSTTNMKAPVGLTVSKVYVESGDTVKKGQKLVKIDELSIVNALLEAEKQLEDVEDELEEDDLSDLEEEKLEQEKESLEDMIDTLEDLHDSSIIKASTAGTISSITVSEGSEITKTSSSSNSSSSGSSSTSNVNGANISEMSYRTEKKADGRSSIGTITKKSSSDSQMLLLSSDTLSDILIEEESTQELTEQVEQIMITDYSDFSIEMPKKGEEPQSEIRETESYSGSISWNAGNVFQASTEYTATIVLRAKENYYFSASSLPMISGAVYDWRIEDQTVLRMTATFEKTESEPTTESTGQLTTANTSSTVNTQDYSTKQQDGTYSSSGTEQQNVGVQSTTSSGITNSGNNSETNYSNSSTGTSSGQSSGTVSGTSSGLSSGTVASASGNSSATSSGTAQTVSGSSSNSSSESSNSIINNYEAVIGTILVQDEASVTVSIDELDILEIKEGQTANITLDAVEDKEYEGKISKIATEATNSGGSAKYQVEISLPIDENMKTGMSASVTIHTAQAENVVVIPVLALQEKENKTFVYTKTDEEGNLSGEVEVETGVSDGTNVEITSGLSQGDTVYYTKATSSSDSQEEKKPDGGNNLFSGEGGGERGNPGGGSAPGGGGPGGGGR